MRIAQECRQQGRFLSRKAAPPTPDMLARPDTAPEKNSDPKRNFRICAEVVVAMVENGKYSVGKN